MEPLNILAVIASGAVFDQIAPAMSRSDLKVKRVRSGRQGLILAQDFAYDLILSQHPMADLGFREFFATVRAEECDSRRSPMLIVTRESRLDHLGEFLDGVGVQAACIDSAPEQLAKALNELVGLAVRVKSRVLVALRVDTEPTASSDLYQAVNISESGLLLRSSHPPALGQELPLTLHLPDDQLPIVATAEVVRHARPEFEGVRGAGFRLLSVEDGGRERLAAYIGRELGGGGSAARPLKCRPSTN